MTAFEVQHRYGARRDGVQFGPWEGGETVDLEPADAEWVERDSPGCLKPSGGADGGERQKPPAANRQHRGGANRAG